MGGGGADGRFRTPVIYSSASYTSANQFLTPSLNLGTYGSGTGGFRATGSQPFTGTFSPNFNTNIPGYPGYSNFPNITGTVTPPGPGPPGIGTRNTYGSGR